MSMRRTIHVLMAALGFLLAASSVSARDEPNHLEPIPAYDHWLDGYAQIVFRTLIEHRFPEVWMIALPSFRPEYAVILRRVEPEDSSEAYYELEYAIAEQPIWNHKDVGNSTYVHDFRDDVAVDRHLARLPVDVAHNLVDSWKFVVRQTRYAEEDRLVCDGVYYDFYASPLLFGETWSPESGIPKMMVDCGELLIQYVESASQDRTEILGQMQNLIRKLRDESD
jgi:hypothetical protein